MATHWITALKLVPWDKVIDATPQIIKTAKGMLRKKEAQQQHDQHQATEAARGALADGAGPALSTGELALQQVRQLQERLERQEQSQRQSLELIEKLAEQNAQLVATVGALRVGAQRLVWACIALGAVSLGLVIYLVATASHG
ncbi:hypothetical protein H9K76_17205 [Diaphorobacter ruginosibacter]|uniref:Uncharacterized protein n=1 Tax=Diaphorobacter ruginosibacter TaxID=1715720 RepID=A0A7G9RL01_9BURK|nr:hypothetical protein [Diaphorobacter ruginosibacter]QNN56276.1 hypothetical protein H9K76_17205 [Diaphorobacter ruginosibacter]